MVATSVVRFARAACRGLVEEVTHCFHPSVRLLEVRHVPRLGDDLQSGARRRPMETLSLFHREAHVSSTMEEADGDVRSAHHVLRVWRERSRQ